MTFTAGLGVIEGTQAVTEALGFIEFGLVGLVGSVIHHAIAFVIEAGRSLRILSTGVSESSTEKDRNQQELHRSSQFWRKGAGS
jgi:hypothetical protein